MKLLIAVALLVVGLSPSPGFSQFGESSGQTTEALTDAPTEAPTDGKKVFRALKISVPQSELTSCLRYLVHA